jgi:type II secretory pathway component PulC
MVFRATVIALLGSLLVLHIGSEVRSAHHHAESRAQWMPRYAQPAPIIVRQPAARSQMPASTIVVDARRSELERLVADGAIADSARLVLAVSHGEPIGAKVYAIAPGGVMATLGFDNGDTILAMNDAPFRADRGQELLLDAISSRDAIDFTIRRAGARLRIVVLIH